VQALIRTAGENGQPLRILEAVEAANAAQKDVLIGKIEQRFGADLSGRTFAVWGLAFKPNTDDMREAPSRRLIAALLARARPCARTTRSRSTRRAACSRSISKQAPTRSRVCTSSIRRMRRSPARMRS
jgi:UDP-N-acetyl-D-mannosaminuronate dehydrogenase